MRRLAEDINGIIDGVDRAKAKASAHMDTARVIHEERRDMTEMTVPPKDLKQFTQTAKEIAFHAGRAHEAFGKGDADSMIKGFSDLGLAIMVLSVAIEKAKIDKPLAAKLDKISREVPRLALKYFDEGDM